MDAHRLVKMANEIAAFFAVDPEREIVLESVAGHLKRFWDPRMRGEILRWVDEQGGEGLTPIALDAIKAHRDKLAPPAR